MTFGRHFHFSVEAHGNIYFFGDRSYLFLFYLREEPKGSLPEGFFDDPKKDAKARKVEYKDPMTEEWEKFQKSIQKEDDVRKDGRG